MKKPLPLEVIIAFNNPREAQTVLVKNNIKPARNHQELVRKLNAFLVQDKENALKQLAQIHPDKDLILTYGGTEAKSGCGGCSGADGKSSACGCSGAEGDENGVEDKSSKEVKKTEDATPKKAVEVWDSVKPYAPLIITGAFLLVGLAIVVKRA